MKKKKKLTASDMAALSVKVRHKGKTKKQIREYYSQLAQKRWGKKLSPRTA